jgi:hypothetical protein
MKSLIVLFVAAVLAACSRGERCENCGMKLDSTSAWVVELRATGTVRRFDTPRCAFAARRAGRAQGDLMVRDFYDRRERSESEVVFVTGSDVLGPMGADLVPVDTARAGKFVSDHGGHALVPSAVDEVILRNLK